MLFLALLRTWYESVEFSQVFMTFLPDLLWGHFPATAYRHPPSELAPYHGSREPPASAPTCFRATFPLQPTATPLLNWRHTTDPGVWRQVRRGVALWQVNHGLAGCRLLIIEGTIAPPSG